MKPHPALQEFAEELGINIVMVSRGRLAHQKTPAWQWPTIHTNNNENLAHELAHFIVADETRRYVTNYGLGNDVDTNYRASPKLLTDTTIQLEELQASILGIIMLDTIGYPYVERVARNHNWYYGDFKWREEVNVKSYRNGDKTKASIWWVIQTLSKRRLIKQKNGLFVFPPIQCYCL